jgi:uracil-DNA glycosylase
METFVEQAHLQSDWDTLLRAELEQPYIRKLSHFLSSEIQLGKVIYPDPKLIFNAFNSTPRDEIKVVILGQDPYHGASQANGLSFSVQRGIDIPPSLRNIFKEIHHDLGIPMPSHGSLQTWTKQGVLLLNATLTVEHGKAGAHQGKGWEKFTDHTIKLVGDTCEGVVFMLWGNHAHKKIGLIDTKKHLVLTASHPSPLSAHRGFFGCKHFSRANEYLISIGKTPIDWTI